MKFLASCPNCCEEQEVEQPGPVQCRSCDHDFVVFVVPQNSEGVVRMIDCPNCKGLGSVDEHGNAITDQAYRETCDCEPCEGTGKVNPAELAAIVASAEDLSAALTDAVARLAERNAKLGEELKAKVDDVLDKAGTNMRTLDAFIDFVEQIRDPKVAKRVSKVCSWLERAATYRAASLELTETKAAGAATAAEAVAQAAIEAARVGL